MLFFVDRCTIETSVSSGSSHKSRFSHGNEPAGVADNSDVAVAACRRPAPSSQPPEAPAPSLATLVTVPGPGPLWPACRFVARDPSSPSLMTLRPLWFDESAETETARMYAASYKKCQLPE